MESDAPATVVDGVRRLQLNASDNETVRYLKDNQ
jgi:hypothetical protein